LELSELELDALFDASSSEDSCGSDCAYSDGDREDVWSRSYTSYSEYSNSDSEYTHSDNEDGKKRGFQYHDSCSDDTQCSTRSYLDDEVLSEDDTRSNRSLRSRSPGSDYFERRARTKSLDGGSDSQVGHSSDEQHFSDGYSEDKRNSENDRDYTSSDSTGWTHESVQVDGESSIDGSAEHIKAETPTALSRRFSTVVSPKSLEFAKLDSKADRVARLNKLRLMKQRLGRGKSGISNPSKAAV
jgi:hypothetical protein